MHKPNNWHLKSILKRYLGRIVHKGTEGMSSPETDRERRRLQALQRTGEIKLGTGKLPEGFWDLPRPKDPTGSIRQALIQERKESV